MSRRNRLAAGWMLALGAMVLFASLGSWQLRRMHVKQAMLEAAGRVLAQREAGPLALAADGARRLEYDWVADRGRFVGPPLLLDNQIRDGRVGVRVYRVLRPVPGPGAAPADLLADLGWLPVRADRRMPEIAAASGEPVDVRGLLAPPPSAGIAMGPAMARRDGAWLLTRVDTAAIARALALPGPLAPRVLRLDPRLPIGYARDLDLLPNTLPPERHLGYAVQWYGLALAVLATALVLTFRKPRR